MAQPPAIRASDAEREAVAARRLRLPRGLAASVAGGGALVALWMADVGAREPLIVGDSDFFRPIVPMLAWGAVLLRRRRPRQRRLTT